MTDVLPASKIEPREVKWLYKDRIPLGMLTIVAGKPDQGKGLFAAHLAADVSKRGGNVLYSAIEDDAGMMTRPRLEAAGANLDRILLWRFRVPAQFDELEAHVIDNDIRLIVMDPMAGHLSTGVSRHSDKIREVTTPLAKLAEKQSCSVLIVEHALKRVSPKAHPLSAIGGSGSGLPAASRMAFVFGTDPEDADHKVLSCVKSNIREKPKALSFEVDTETIDYAKHTAKVAYLLYQKEIEFDARRLLAQEPDGKDGSSKPGPAPDKRAAAAEWLATHLFKHGKPMPAGTVMEDAKQAGVSPKTVRRAADDIQIVKDPPGGGRGCTWDLPKPLRKAMKAANQ